MAAKRRQSGPKASFRLVVTWPRLLICLVICGLLVGAYFVIPLIFPQKVQNPINLDQDAPALTVHAVDVGQGDCTIIQFPDNKVMMIDTGKPAAYNTILNYLESIAVTNIDWLIITHPDDDHYGSAYKLLMTESLTFGVCYRSPYTKKDSQTTYKRLLENERYPVEIPSDSERVLSAPTANYTITLVSPYISEIDNYKDSNDASLCLVITYYNKVFVFTGDAENKGEGYFRTHAQNDTTLFNDLNNKQVIFQAGHHGSRTSNQTATLDLIFSPVTANNFVLISCGKDNDYGHPHAEALTRLQQHCDAGNIYNTVDVGSIVVQATADGLVINGSLHNAETLPLSYTMILVGVGVVLVTLCFVDFRGIKVRY